MELDHEKPDVSFDEIVYEYVNVNEYDYATQQAGKELRNAFYGLYYHWFDRYITVSCGVRTCLHLGNFINHIHAVSNLPENCIAEALGIGSCVIKEGVVLEIDKKLAGCTIHDGRTCHGERTTLIGYIG